jgi:hypothetical protein
VKDFSEDKVENDFENIVFQFIENEREGKPLNWNTSRPFVSKDKTGKPTGNGFIKYISLESFKDKLQDVLLDSNLKDEVIEDYRNIFIDNALLINDVNTIYKELTNELATPPYNGTLQSQYNYAYTKLAVKELIRFKVFLNTIDFKNEPQSIKTLENHFHNITDFDSFIKDIEKAFQNEKGKTFVGVAKILKENDVLVIQDREIKPFLDCFKKSTNLKIPSNSYFGRKLKELEGIEKKDMIEPLEKPIKTKLDPIINKYKSGS